MNLIPMRFQVLVAAFLCGVGVCAADMVYFVVAPPNYTSTNSYVLPLADPEDIQTARKWVAGGTGLEVWDYTPWHRVRVGSDGMNRDVLQPGQPLWSWHVESFTRWGPSTFGDDWPYLGPWQLDQLILGGEFTNDTELAFSGGFYIIAELNAPVELYYYQRLPLGTSTTILLYWSHDLPSANYTLEWTPSFDPADWQPVDYDVPGFGRIGGSIVEVNSALIGRAFFRLKAE